MSKLEKEFQEFHRENPHVYGLFHRFAMEAWSSERKAFSVAMIWERMRWYTLIETKDETYKLNNNHKAYYARLWMGLDPKREGFFRTRRLTSGDR